MAALTGKCDTATVQLTASAEVGIGGVPLTYLEQETPLRVGPVSSPFMLYMDTDNVDKDCVNIKVERIVDCPSGCLFSERKLFYSYETAPHCLLPAGTYDITVCKQSAYPLEDGDTLDVNFFVEPVSDSFVNVYKQKG